MPDPIFSDLYRDTEHLVWPPTEQVRRRGRQRTRRIQIAAGLAAAVAVGVVASGVALARPDAAPPPVPPATVVPTPPTPAPAPTPSSTPSAEPSESGSPTPSRTTGRPPGTTGGETGRAPTRTIPAAAMLQLADLPTGFTMTTKVEGDWSLESVTIYCENESPALNAGQVASRSVQFDSPSDWIVERVTRHSGTSADTVMKRVRQLVTGCRPTRPEDSLSIMAESLGGDDAVLVGGDMGTPARWVVVRQGDLVAQLRVDHQTTPSEAKRVVGWVVNRLCAGTDTC
ncbi:hypothetical protein [Micromonospora aurantiaca]|uniref:hypothetical protein n=1 Tax=Micromonospora aurantiaca (nom. illeg.) TaxID=47850 RepID=UPI0038089378